MLTGLHHAALAAPPGCEEEARRFFGGLLGLAELAKPPALAAHGGVWFACGAQELHVGVDPGFAPARKAHPALSVAGGHALAALAERFVGAGIAVQWDDAVPGVVRFYADDPWGNRLEFVAAAG